MTLASIAHRPRTALAPNRFERILAVAALVLLAAGALAVAEFLTLFRDGRWDTGCSFDGG